METPAKLQAEQLVQIGVGCQLESFPAELDGGPPSRLEPWSWYLRRRSRRLFIKIGTTLKRLVARTEPRPSPAGLPVPELAPGDRVRVRSAEYIRGTLDEKGMLKGCGFGLGMYQYCGQERRVAKVVTRFFDEARGRMLKSRNMVLLEGVYCDGASSPDTLGCDRMCFYFWRTEWLEKVGEPGSSGPA